MIMSTTAQPSRQRMWRLEWAGVSPSCRTASRSGAPQGSIAGVVVVVVDGAVDDVTTGSGGWCDGGLRQPPAATTTPTTSATAPIGDQTRERALTPHLHHWLEPGHGTSPP